MRISFILCLAIILFVVFVPIASSAQDQRATEPITVKNKEVKNGVVILGVQSGKTSFELPRDRSVSGCASTHGVFCDNAAKKRPDPGPGNCTQQTPSVTCPPSTPGSILKLSHEPPTTSDSEQSPRSPPASNSSCFAFPRWAP